MRGNITALIKRPTLHERAYGTHERSRKQKRGFAIIFLRILASIAEKPIPLFLNLIMCADAKNLMFLRAFYESGA